MKCRLDWEKDELPWLMERIVHSLALNGHDVSLEWQANGDPTVKSGVRSVGCCIGSITRHNDATPFNRYENSTKIGKPVGTHDATKWLAGNTPSSHKAKTSFDWRLMILQEVSDVVSLLTWDKLSFSLEWAENGDATIRRDDRIVTCKADLIKKEKIYPFRCYDLTTGGQNLADGSSRATTWLRRRNYSLSW